MLPWLRGEIEGGTGDQSPSAPVIIGGALHHYQVPPLTPIYSGANVRHRAFLGVRRPSLRENMQSADACFLPCAANTFFSHFNPIAGVQIKNYLPMYRAADVNA